MNGIVAPIGAELRRLSAVMTHPRDGECLLCYLQRMVAFGCRDLRWSQRYRDLTAPRATGLERRLAAMGGYCDCEVLFNAYVPLTVLAQPGAMPAAVPRCRGVRRGSTQPCRLWARRPRYGWVDEFSA